MAWEVWLTFFGAAIAIAVSPGAGAIQSMATGLTHGVRRGYWSILGLEVGLMLQLALVAIGLGAAVANSILAFNIIKWIGVAYLIYLAVRQWRTATVDLREQIGKAMDGGRLSLLVRGFLVNATNPKGLVFFLAVLPQFVVPTAPLLPQYLAIGVTMVAVDLVVMGLYTGSVRAAAQVDAHASPTDGRQPRVLGLVRRGRGGAVAGAARPGYRVNVSYRLMPSALVSTSQRRRETGHRLPRPRPWGSPLRRGRSVPPAHPARSRRIRGRTCHRTR